MRCLIIILLAICLCKIAKSQAASRQVETNTINFGAERKAIEKRFQASSKFLDAAINSINSFNSVIKKENYRNKITSLNNPTSSDMGFSLENEIQTALKPLLAKAKNTNTDKFSQVVSSLLTIPAKTGTVASKTAAPVLSPLFTSLIGLVGTLTIQEKRITRDDLDSFINTTSKYFVLYEKLDQANSLFDQNIGGVNNKLIELQFDLKECLLDMIAILYPDLQRAQLKTINPEDLYLKYLDEDKLNQMMDSLQSAGHRFQYPSDGIKTAKDLSNTLQKLFTEYQKVYSDNYQQIKTIVSESKSLSKNINTQQVDASLKELEDLYNDSKNSDVLSLRLSTLTERLKTLSDTEQIPDLQKLHKWF